VKIRLIGTLAEVHLAVYRLREAFSTVDAGQPIPCRDQPGQYRIYAVASF
jgi:hypothetical protein